MAVVISMWSRKDGEVKRFLERYYQKEINMDEDVGQWIYVYSKPLDAIDIISAVMDNNDKYQLAISIQIDKGDVHLITTENHNDIIKGMLCLYYQQPTEVTY